MIPGDIGDIGDIGIVSVMGQEYLPILKNWNFPTSEGNFQANLVDR